uniref:Uncharacterized protein n=1 Tax=Rhizophora mucronata TaxID=61149 RepID=A0A2P2P182_RHIMU
MHLLPLPPTNQNWLPRIGETGHFPTTSRTNISL